MVDFIEIKQKQAVVALADTLNYDEAAQRLGITTLELKCQIESLESKLYLRIFALSETPALTEDGRILLEVIRKALHQKTHPNRLTR